MKRLHLAILLILAAPAMRADSIEIGIDLIIRESNLHLRAAGSVAWKNIFGSYGHQLVTASGFITNTDASYSESAITPFNFTIESSTTATPPNCYQALVQATAEGTSGSGQSNTICEYGPVPTRYRLEVRTCLDGGCTVNNSDYHDAGNTVVVYTSGPPSLHFDGWSGDITSTSLTVEVYMDRDKSVTANWTSLPPPPPPPPPQESGCSGQECLSSPIVINLAGAYQLTGQESPVLFDIRADGHPVQIGWTAADAPMAFLALDRNGNGMIDNGAELFGNHTPLPTGLAAANGFDALAAYDTNGDGILDTHDPEWSALLLWTDLNHDGLSQPAEIEPVSTSAVTRIDLNYHWTGRNDQHGNQFRYQSTVWLGQRRERATPRPVYDIYFVAVP